MGNQPSFTNTDDDLEAGQTLEPMMPELRCLFTRKIFILASQLLLTIVFAAIVVSNHPIVTFLTTTALGFACYIVIVITPFIMLCQLCYYRNYRRVKYVIFGIFTVFLSFGIGLTCAYTSRKLIMEVSLLTTMVTMSFTLFTLWAAKRGYEFNFLGPFLLGAIMVLLIFAVIQKYFPLDGISILLYGCLPATIFDQMERFGSHVINGLATNSIANSPNNSNDTFVMNYSMTNFRNPISEFCIMIKADEKTSTPKPSQVLTRKEGKSRKPQTETKGKGLVIKELVEKLVPKNKRKQEQDLSCYHCGRLGHTRSDCQSYIEDLKKGKAGQSSKELRTSTKCKQTDGT
ncbi:protein LIFEGUARD 2-like [Bidens hawaiensis]|uniref:protein LIFEGUARD 2-like n=1 Tax=Bidens hawaiensis TaxID=980011 RepID=UPI00404B06F9